LGHIDSLVTQSGNSSKWQSVRKSLKIQYNQNKLDLFVKRLESLRSALSFDVIQALKNDIKKNYVATDTRLGVIQDDMKAVVTQLEGSRIDSQVFEATIQRCLERFWQQRTFNHQNATGFQISQALIPGGIASLSNRDGYNGYGPQQIQLSTKENEILKMLRFRQMTDRFEEVSEACRRTFDWIFSPLLRIAVGIASLITLETTNKVAHIGLMGRQALGNLL
jgi:hypothetical protein